MAKQSLSGQLLIKKLSSSRNTVTSAGVVDRKAMQYILFR